MQKSPLATQNDITALSIAVNTATVAIIATLLESRDPGQPFGNYLERAISRLQSVDFPNTHVK
jgi:hypothetical protein